MHDADHFLAPPIVLLFAHQTEVLGNTEKILVDGKGKRWMLAMNIVVIPGSEHLGNLDSFDDVIRVIVGKWFLRLLRAVLLLKVFFPKVTKRLHRLRILVNCIYYCLFVRLTLQLLERHARGNLHDDAFIDWGTRVLCPHI